MNITEPDSGVILDDMVFEEGTELVATDFLDFHSEIKYVGRNPIKPNTTDWFLLRN